MLQAFGPQRVLDSGTHFEVDVDFRLRSPEAFGLESVDEDRSYCGNYAAISRVIGQHQGGPLWGPPWFVSATVAIE